MTATGLQDSYRHKGLRKKLVNKLIAKGIKDRLVLNAIGSIPRHYFLDSAFEDLAYEDQALPIGAGQTISQPYTVAYQTILLDVKPGMRVLEIGTGSGYQACVLESLGVQLFTIERQIDLYRKTSKLLPKIGFNKTRIFHKDGFLGLPEIAPFDRILVTAGAPVIPPKLLAQLKTDGIMVIPVQSGNFHKMNRIKKGIGETYKSESFDDFKFVPLLEGKVD
jgi:protein-L-isoaspartate(D-aspartate) O-methyltransferase